MKPHESFLLLRSFKDLNVYSCYYSSNGLQPSSDGLHIPLHGIEAAGSQLPVQVAQVAQEKEVASTLKQAPSGACTLHRKGLGRDVQSPVFEFQFEALAPPAEGFEVTEVDNTSVPFSRESSSFFVHCTNCLVGWFLPFGPRRSLLEDFQGYHV